MFPPTLLAAALAAGVWGAAGCGPVGPNADYVWRNRPDDPDRSYLYRNGVQVGGYDRTHDVYRSYDARRTAWGPAQPAPWKSQGATGGLSANGSPRTGGQAARGTQPSEAIRNFGVDTDKLQGRGDESYRLNGLPASREAVRKALGDQRVPDDAARLRLTLIGEPAATAPVADDLARAAALFEWKDRLLVQSYPPGHWAVARSGFKTDGQPTIYLQAPDGSVLHRQDDYRDGPEGLAAALRRADPHYDPRKDPDLRQRLFRPSIQLSSLPAPVWFLAAGLVFLLVRRR